MHYQASLGLTHRGRVTHIYVGELTIIDSDNGLSPGRRQAIIWTNAGILLIGPLGTNFSEILIETHTFSFTKMHLKMSSGKWRPSCLGLNELSHYNSNWWAWIKLKVIRIPLTVGLRCLSDFAVMVHGNSTRAGKPCVSNTSKVFSTLVALCVVDSSSCPVRRGCNGADVFFVVNFNNDVSLFPS